MNVVIDLANFESFFRPERFDTAKALHLPWFIDCSFESSEWVLENHKNVERSYILKLANEPIAPGGVLLGSNPDLLRSIKLFLIFTWSMKKDKVGVNTTTAEGVYKLYTKLIQFIRYLYLVIGIKNLSSINKSVADKILNDFLKKTTIQRLNIEDRAITEIRELFSSPDQIELYKVIPDGRKGCKPEFNHDLFASELGLSETALQDCAEYQDMRCKLLDENGFQFKSTKSAEGKTKTTQTADTIRRNLQPIKGLLKAVYGLHKLFPDSQRASKNWFASVNVSALSKLHATAEKNKTKDIPRQVFYRLMDEAIRWVVMYSDELLDFKNKAVNQYESYIETISALSNAGTLENKRHYASKKMTKWFAENQPSLFPHAVNGLERSTSNHERATDPETVEIVKKLRDQDLTFKEIGEKLGIHKTSAHRLFNYTIPLSGASISRVINTHLVSACLLVIFAFTARRRDEVLGLKVGCIEELNSCYFITIDQQKKNQGERPLPTTKLVAMAVELLEKIGLEAREKLASDKLLALSNFVSGETQEAWPDFNDFCDYCKIPALCEKGHDYSFAHHQFRRFLAMTYYYKSPDPDLPTLTWFLGHKDAEMTMEYITDKQGQWAFKSVKNERIIDLIEEEFKAGSSVVGEDLKEQFGEIDGQVESRLVRMEKKGNLVDQYVLDFVIDGACFGRTEIFKSRSKCLENGAVQVSSARCGSCEGCPNLVPVAQPVKTEQLDDLTILQSPILAAVKQEGALDV